jgi:hypothetical protein
VTKELDDAIRKTFAENPEIEAWEIAERAEQIFRQEYSKLFRLPDMEGYESELRDWLTIGEDIETIISLLKEIYAAFPKGKIKAVDLKEILLYGPGGG